MIKLSVEEIKEVQINILKVVTAYCEREGLTYFLGYGTLLGAVRHKGYIPWDDDIDIIMPRYDYETLIKNFQHVDINVKSHYKDMNYPYKFAKVSYEGSKLIENTDLKYNIGINIDVFPLDTFPDSKKIKWFYRKNKFLQNLLNIKTISINPNRKLYKNLILKIGKIILTSVEYRKIIYEINKKAMSYMAFNDNKLMGCMVDTYGIKDIMSKSIFANKIKLEFEGHKFDAPERYHEYLINIYGEYMTLPPEDERKTHHDFEAFRL